MKTTSYKSFFGYTATLERVRLPLDNTTQRRVFARLSALYAGVLLRFLMRLVRAIFVWKSAKTARAAQRNGQAVNEVNGAARRAGDCVWETTAGGREITSASAYICGITLYPAAMQPKTSPPPNNSRTWSKAYVFVHRTRFFPHVFALNPRRAAHAARLAPLHSASCFCAFPNGISRSCVKNSRTITPANNAEYRAKTRRWAVG